MAEGGPSFFTKVKHWLAAGAVGGTVVGGAEITAHPIQNTIDTTKNAIEQGIDNTQQARQDIVSFYNESAEVQAYNEQVAARLNGRKPLLEGEQIFEKVEVIPAGANLEELTKMKQEGTPVNVRDYPGTYTPNGHFTKIIGKLPQGTIIEQAILVRGTVPNATTPNTVGDWLGFVYKTPDSNPNEPGKIGYIYGIFGQSQTPTTPSE